MKAKGKRRSGRVRCLVQLGAAFLLTWLFLRQNFMTATRPFFSWAGGMDPWLGVAGLYSLKARWLVIISVIMLMLAVRWGRVFCGWGCPVGFILDRIATLKRLVKWRNRQASGRFKTGLEWVRWGFFGAVLGWTLSGKLGVLAVNPLVLWPREVAGIVSGLSWPWVLTGIIVGGLIFFPRLWCRFICPVGSLLNLAHLIRCQPKVASDTCRHCGGCVARCPVQNIDPATIRFGFDCLGCGQCKALCPENSIGRPKVTGVRIDGSRRQLLIAGIIGAGTLVLNSFVPRVLRLSQKPSSGNLLRPPGALEEAGLAATCIRCSQCIQVCPAKVLEPTGWEAGLGSWGTPRFHPEKGQCVFCKSCGQVCPTDALVPVTSQTARIGTAEVEQKRCVAWKNGTHCLLCVETCTFFAISADPKRRPVIDTQRCIGCGACEANCALDQPAIHVTAAGEQRRKS